MLSLAALILQMISPVAYAQSGCSVTALDTVAGLGTEVSVNSCAASTSLTMTLRRPADAGQDYTQIIVTDTLGNASTLIPSKFTVTAGDYTVIIGNERAMFSVLPDRADDSHSSLIASSNMIRGDGQDTLTVTALIRDRYDNPVSGRPLALIASRLGDDVTAQSKQTDEEGRFLWTVRSTQEGTMTLIPYDILSARQMKLRADITVGLGRGSNTWLQGSVTGLGQGGTIQADLTSSALVDHFELELPQGATKVKANDLFTLTIRALRGTDLVRGYLGTLIVQSSDPDADLPKKGNDPKSPSTGSLEMRDVDQGERKVPLAFVLRHAGQQTIEVHDKDDPTITGEITITVEQETSSTTETIVILDPKDRSRIQSGPILLQGKAPSLVNLKVKGGKEVVSGETDEEGVFRISVPINAEDKEVTLFVTSENGTYESEPVHVIIDNEPPKITSVNFDPAEGKTGDPATITVVAEEHLGSITATFEGKEIPCSGSGTTYTGTITAPTEPGTFDLTVTATDEVGNPATMFAKWTVKSKTLPIVEGVSAESLPAQVSLKWQAVTSVPISEYKIYIAKDSDPFNYLYSVSTKKPVSSATIKDLPFGQTYLFSITALNAEGLESPEKSTAVSASPLGMLLTAKPGKDSVLLEWTKISNLPLDHYVLQYGTEPDAYTETRTIDGEAESTIIHDLLGNVTYEFKLTPVTVTGKTMNDLSAKVLSTVGGGSFTPGPTDPVPPDMIGHPGATIEPPITTPPENTGSGLSSTVLWASLILAGLGVLQWRHLRLERERTRNFLQMMSERYHA